MTPRDAIQASWKPATRATLDLLRAHPEGVTALTALDAIGSFRLGARVYELREAGHLIVTDWITTASHKRIARYRIVENEQIAGRVVTNNLT